MYNIILFTKNIHIVAFVDLKRNISSPVPLRALAKELFPLTRHLRQHQSYLAWCGTAALTWAVYKRLFGTAFGRLFLDWVEAKDNVVAYYRIEACDGQSLILLKLENISWEMLSLN